jgi:hypothetical protein
MKVLEREIGSLDYAANQTRTLPLPRNYAYRQLFLLLIVDLTRAATAADGGGPKDSAPAQLVQNITIRANGRDVIKSIDFETLHRLSEQRHHTRPYIYAEDWSGYADAADKVMKVSAVIDFAMWDAIRPIDTLLDSAGLATLDMIITWGTGMDTMNDTWPGSGGSAESVTVNSATLYVSAIEEVGVPAGARFMANKEYMIRKQVTATDNNFQIDLPTGNLFRSFVIKTHSDGDQVDSIIPFAVAAQNTIQIGAGTEVFKHRIASSLQAHGKLMKELEIPERTGSAAALNHRLQSLLQEGYYLLEFCPDGRLTEALDTEKLSSLKLTLQVVSVGTDDFIDVFPVELIPPPKLSQPA